ncbi:hypothetical protein AcV5_007875 [Taiwanofungus camphoratus]|nr:hypothetical protein AcV5_007875 [Antrodia cinnamomea]KAI0947072.1 hypothetical protein AcV7_009602 [Antrodia cinnamomea]
MTGRAELANLSSGKPSDPKPLMALRCYIGKTIRIISPTPRFVFPVLRPSHLPPPINSSITKLGLSDIIVPVLRARQRLQVYMSTITIPSILSNDFFTIAAYHQHAWRRHSPL